MMSDPLFPIIRKVEKKSPDKDCVLVHIDGTGRAFKPRLMNAVAGLIRLSDGGHVYEVRIDTPLELYDIAREVRTFRTKERTDFTIRLKLVARGRNAEKIAESLHDKARGPGDVLLDTVDEVLKSMTEKPGEDGPEKLINRILSNRDMWAVRLAEGVESKTGLEVQVYFEGRHQSIVTEIAVHDVAVKPRDAPHRENLTLTVFVTLEPIGDRVHEQLPESQERRLSILRTVVIDAMRTDVMLYQYWYDQSAVQSAIRRQADAVLRSFAYRCGDVRTNPVAAPLPIEEQIAAVVPWSGYRGREVRFYIDSLMRMKEDGAGLYDSVQQKENRFGQQDRKGWLEREGRAALKTAMHDRDFYDLTLAEQKNVEEIVRDKLAQAAARFGHTIEAIIARVRLPETRWLDRQYLDLPAQEYPMKNALAVADFGATIEVKFGKLRPLIDYIDQLPQPAADAGGNASGASGQGPSSYDSGIKPAILDLVRKTIATAMRDIETIQYFAAWEKWDIAVEEDQRAERDQTNYVRNTIILAVKREILRRFEPEIVNVRLHRIDRRVTEIWEIIAGFRSFFVEGFVDPLGSRSLSERVPYTLRAWPREVPAPEWPKVIRLGKAHFDKESILTSIADAAREFLGGRSRREIDALNIGVRDTGTGEAIKTAMEQYINRHLLDLHGFSIVLESVVTDYSRGEGADRAIQAIADEDQLAEIKRIELARKLAVTDLERRISQSNALIDRLNADLLSNPRIQAEEDARYNRDLKRRDEAQAELDELMRQSANAARRSIASGLAAQRLGGLVSPEAPAARQDPTPETDGDGTGERVSRTIDIDDDDIIPPREV